MGEEMNVQHRNLDLERWGRMPLAEQMANIGSEVGRALNWQKKGNEAFSEKAVSRALELLELSLSSVQPFHRIKELARLKEAVVDYFLGSNEFSSSEMLWRKYFDHFNYLARKKY